MKHSNKDKLQLVLNDLIPNGIDSRPLSELIIEAEETLCDQYLESEIKREERSGKAKQRRIEKKLEDYLDNIVCFRDYDILPKSQFGTFNKIAVHQCVDVKTLEHDVKNALYNFHRDGFGSIVFYV